MRKIITAEFVAFITPNLHGDSMGSHPLTIFASAVGWNSGTKIHYQWALDGFEMNG
jgi:hypothetical protein